MHNYLSLTNSPSQKNTLIFLSILSVVTVFIWQGNVGFDLNDEGFLWYGVQRVMLGEVPVLDFMSYDPGRYYWSAAIMRIFSDNGLIALRASVALFQIFGLITGLYLIFRREERINILYLLLTISIFLLWMFPRHKLFDISLSIFLIGILTFLVEKPSNRRFFITGIGIGLVAFFGRNHGVYGVLGFLYIIVWLKLHNPEKLFLIKKAGYSLAGLFIGFSPMILMILFVDNFANAFWYSIRFLFEINTTNAAVQIPWPWLVDFSSTPVNIAVRKFLTGILFLSVVMFSLTSLWLLISKKYQHKKPSPVFLAAMALCLPYLHHALSRADINHLAQSIFPFIIVTFIYINNKPAKIKWGVAFLLFTTSLFIMVQYHPGFVCSKPSICKTITISKSKVIVHRNIANKIKLISDLVKKYSPKNHNFLITPYWAGAYALYETKSPAWNIYAVFPRKKIFQLKEVKRIKNASPDFVLLLKTPIDNNTKWLFKNIRPLTYRYITNNFVLSKNEPPNSEYEVYLNKKYR